MTSMTTTATIRSLEERYPFNAEELEILVRCHEKLSEDKNNDDFLTTLAKAYLYSVFFLPGDEMRDRIEWIEYHILPMGFSSRLRCAITADSFVDYANQGEGKSLERFIEGIADTGRRGSRESLKVIYDILDEDATAKGLVELCICMAIAADALVVPNLEKTSMLQRLKDAEPCILSMARSLTEFHKGDRMSKGAFISWAEEKFPGLSSTLATFTHNLLFHGHQYPKPRVPYTSPKITDQSEIFESNTSPLLLALSFSNTGLGGKWLQLYGSGSDEGRSFNRLEHSLLGYTGPTVTVVKTTANSVMGAYTSMPWKTKMEFSGDSGSYLFQLKPKLAVYHATEDSEENFAFLHTDTRSTLMFNVDRVSPGLGFGGSLDWPRLFIPESLENCHAKFFDKTYEVGELVPPDELEKFDIAAIEIWAVGDDDTIKKALRDRDEYRERHETYLMNARVVKDKSQFVADFESGLIPNSIYDHKRHARGRPEFAVDEEHDGYKIERE